MPRRSRRRCMLCGSQEVLAFVTWVCARATCNRGRRFHLDPVERGEHTHAGFLCAEHRQAELRF